LSSKNYRNGVTDYLTGTSFFVFQITVFMLLYPNKVNEDELFNDNERFIEKCVPEFSQLEDQIKTLDKQIEERKKYINDFEEWKAEGEAIDVAFQVLNN